MLLNREYLIKVMGKVMVKTLRYILMMVVVLFHHFSLFGQTDFYANFTTDKSVSGVYSVEMVRQFKPIGTTEIYTQRFHIVQDISDTSVMNDRAQATYHYDDTTVLIALQNRSIVYSLIHPDYYDSFYFEEPNMPNFFRFATINLRYLHNKGNKKNFPFSAGSDTTYEKLDGSEEICTTIVNVELDSSGAVFIGRISIYDILLNDTQYVSIAFQGSRISTDSFETLFQKSSLIIREMENNRSKVGSEPEVPSIIDTPRKVVQLDSALYKRLAESNISGKSISITPNGKYKVFYFYFNGCIPCMLAKPYIRELQQDSRFELVAINGYDKDTSEIRYRLERDSIEGIPIIMADRDLLKSFYVSPFPTVIVFDENGKEVDRCEGFKEEWYRDLVYKGIIPQKKR